MNDENKPVVIDVQSRITVGLLITIISGVYFISSLSFKVSASEKEIDELKIEIRVLNKIDKRLSRLEDHFGIKDPKGINHDR